jgi:hypothetical protein
MSTKDSPIFHVDTSNREEHIARAKAEQAAARADLSSP